METRKPIRGQDRHHPECQSDDSAGLRTSQILGRSRYRADAAHAFAGRQRALRRFAGATAPAVVVASMVAGCSQGDPDHRGVLALEYQSVPSLVGRTNTADLGGNPAVFTSTDGWDVVFDRFEVSVDFVRLLDVEVSGPLVRDLTYSSSVGERPIAEVEIPAREYDSAAFRLDGVSMQLTASKGQETKVVDVTIARPTDFVDCPYSEDLDVGEYTQLTIAVDPFAVLPNGARETATFSFDELAAADTDGDGHITDAELDGAVSSDGGALRAVMERGLVDSAGVGGVDSCVPELVQDP